MENQRGKQPGVSELNLLRSRPPVTAYGEDLQLSVDVEECRSVEEGTVGHVQFSKIIES